MPLPNQQRRHAKNGSSVGTHTRCVHVFCTFGADLYMLSRCLLTKKTLLHPSSVGSLSRVRCWLGTANFDQYVVIRNLWWEKSLSCCKLLLHPASLLHISRVDCTTYLFDLPIYHSLVIPDQTQPFSRGCIVEKKSTCVWERVAPTGVECPVGPLSHTSRFPR